MTADLVPGSVLEQTRQETADYESQMIENNIGDNGLNKRDDEDDEMSGDIRVVEEDGRETPASPSGNDGTGQSRDSLCPLLPTQRPSSTASCESARWTGYANGDCRSASSANVKDSIHINLLSSDDHFLHKTPATSKIEYGVEEETNGASRDIGPHEARKKPDVSMDETDLDNNDVNKKDDEENDDDRKEFADKRSDNSSRIMTYPSQKDVPTQRHSASPLQHPNQTCNENTRGVQMDINREADLPSANSHSGNAPSSPVSGQDRERKASPTLRNEQPGHNNCFNHSAYQSSILASKIDLPNFFGFSRMGGDVVTSGIVGNPALLRSDLTPFPPASLSTVSPLNSGSREAASHLSHPKLILNTPSSHAGSLLHVSHAGDRAPNPLHSVLGRPSPVSPNERSAQNTHGTSPPLAHAGSALGNIQPASDIDIRAALSAAANPDQSVNFPASSALSLGAGLTSYGAGDPALMKNMLGLMPPLLFPPPDLGLMAAARLGRTSLPFTQSLLAASMGRSGGFWPGMDRSVFSCRQGNTKVGHVVMFAPNWIIWRVHYKYIITKLYYVWCL